MKRKAARVGIAAKIADPHAVVLVKGLVDWLEKRHLDYVLDDLLVDPELRRVVPGEKFIPRSALTRSADPIVVLGGDGTLISVSRYPAEAPVTVVGVNIGTLGFLTEVTVDELFPVLEEVLAGKAKVDKRVLLNTQVKRDGKLIREFPALNDIVITKNALARLFDIQVFTDDDYATTISGDGLIVSTPGGSTAYSLSAGGSIVHPGVAALLVTPICPHSLTLRPLVLPASSHLALKLGSKGIQSEDEVFLTIDGQEGMALAPGDTISVLTSEHFIYLARSPSKSYFEVLGSKLKWGTQ